MINLKTYPDDTFSVFTEAVRRKQDPALRDRLNHLAPEISLAFNSYKEHFDNNDLGAVVANDTCAQGKEDLLKLYSFKSKVIRDLKVKIDESQLHIIINTCQNCTINSVNTMDHILAQTHFPEYAVNPLNLFPSCSECNSIKSDALYKDGNKKFLNLYLDKLPKEQYLFVDIAPDLSCQFRIENVHDINEQFFDIIHSHYHSLNLLSRMRVKSIEYITELMNSLKIRKNNLPMETIVREVISTAEENFKIFGYNHFKFILESSLVSSPNFIKYL